MSGRVGGGEGCVWEREGRRGGVCVVGEGGEKRRGVCGRGRGEEEGCEVQCFVFMNNLKSNLLENLLTKPYVVKCNK